MVVKQEEINNMSTKYNEHKQWALLKNGEILKMYWEVDGFLNYRDTFKDDEGNVLARISGILFGTKDRYIHYTSTSVIIAESNIKKELEQYKQKLHIRKKRKMSKKQVDRFIEELKCLGKVRTNYINKY